MRKGQAEFIAILGIIIVAVIAIFYATQTVTPPQPLTQEQKEVRSSLENLIRSGAHETLRVLSTHGGYSSPPSTSEIFLAKDVPYWYKNGASTIPNTKSNFEQTLESYINAQKEGFISGLSGVSVSYASVSANILDSKILLSVNLPATMDSKPIPSKYDIEIITKFGEIIDFSKNFLSAQSNDRYMEYFILASMLASPIENNEQITPMFIYLTGCGEHVFRSWYDLKPNVEDRVKVTLAHTYMPDKVPLNIGDITPYPKYPLPRLNGKPYSDLDVSFHLPDNFELDFFSFQFSPNPIMATATPVAFTGICLSDPIYVNYFLYFPMIVRVKDPITKNVFQFTTDIFIKDNTPGQWTDQEIYEQSEQAQICTDSACPVKIKLTGLNGNPIPGADISFMGCSLGETDSQGTLQATGPCGMGPLQIYKSGYSIYDELASYPDLADEEITLLKNINAKLFFYDAAFANNTITSEYYVESIPLLPEGKRVMVSLSKYGAPPGMDTTFQTIFDSAAGELKGIPPDLYAISAAILNEDLSVAYGSLYEIYYLGEETTELHFYIPTEMNFPQTSEEIMIQTAMMSDVLEDCEIGPVTEIPVSEDAVPCIIPYDEV